MQAQPWQSSWRAQWVDNLSGARHEFVGLLETVKDLEGQKTVIPTHRVVMLIAVFLNSAAQQVFEHTQPSLLPEKLQLPQCCSTLDPVL